MPTVMERTNANGRVTFYVRTRDGLGRNTSERFDTKREAESFAALVTALGGPRAIGMRRREDRASEDYVPTLNERMREHLDGLTGVTERTPMDYADIGRRTFLVPMGDMPLDMIERTDVAKWINSMDRDGKSAKTIANAHSLLSSIFKAAVRDGIVDKNPCEAMRLPRTGEEDREDMRPLSREEYERLLEATPPQWRALVAFLFGSGLRWSEATALTVGQLLPGPPAQAQVRQAWKRVKGKGIVTGPPKSRKARRDALVSLEAVRMLDLDRPRTDLLFTATNGGVVHYGPWRSRVWVPANIAAGLASAPVPGRPYHYDGPGIHDARHSHASWLLSTGKVTLEELQDQLGHESILTTRNTYAKLLPHSRNRLADALNSLAGPALIEG
jgi:integrase